MVDVGPCTCMYQVILLSWCAQATLHQLSCDQGRKEGMYHERHAAGVYRESVTMLFS